MKKTFKWILFSTLILSIGAIIAMMAIYLPQYNTYANYSTKDGHDTFICYDDDSIEVVKNEELGAVPYTFNVRLYNLSNKEQTLTFRFWFTCTDSQGQYYDFVDKEITIPGSTDVLNHSERDYFAGSIDYSCELYQFGHCSDVKFGAWVKVKYLTDMATSHPEGETFVEDVLINKNGIRNVNGFEVTSEEDLCDALSNNTDLMHSLDGMWQRAFTGVIIALSCTGGIFVLCLIFTIILLLPNKKKGIEGF